MERAKTFVVSTRASSKLRNEEEAELSRAHISLVEIRSDEGQSIYCFVPDINVSIGETYKISEIGVYVVINKDPKEENMVIVAPEGFAGFDVYPRWPQEAQEAAIKAAYRIGAKNYGKPEQVNPTLCVQQKDKVSNALNQAIESLLLSGSY